jgi:hypothetical protein
MKFVQRWSEWRPTKEHTLWIAVGCVVATLVLGFGPGGWVTGGSAQKMADEAAAASRQQLAAAVCSEEFLRAANARERLAKLESIQWWERDDHIVAGGWATMPGEKEADIVVAGMCANRLTEHAEANARAAPVSTSARR